MPPFVLAMALTALWLARTANAEPCEPEWVSLGPRGHISAIYVMTTWDADGTGPEPPVVIAAGSLDWPPLSESDVVSWTGEQWEELPPPPIHVDALTTWDPDGDGPVAPLLIAAGVDAPVMAFDGSAWFSLGDAVITSSLVSALSWSSNDTRATPPLLIVTGTPELDGEPLGGVAAWNGTAWAPLGVGAPSTGRALTTWDRDGIGPEPTLLVANGHIFDGTAWVPIDGTPDEGFSAVASGDLDGDGPQPPTLFAAGTPQTSAPNPVYGAYRWTGASWEQLGTLPVYPVRDLLVGDPDGPGPAPIGLIWTNTTQYNRVCYFWNGTLWANYTSGMQTPLHAAIFADPGGPGPQGIRLIVGGPANPQPPSFRDEFGWQPLGSPLSGTVHKLALWDPDGSGPKPVTVFAGGAVFGGTLQGLAQFENGRWTKLGAGPAPYADPNVSNATYHLRPWRGGPAPHDGGVLVALGKYVPASLGLPSGAIPMWNGAAWSSLQPPTAETIGGITTWDADGPGPLPESLIITNATSAYAHDGTSWASLSTPAYLVKAIATAWDPDGNGPETPRLIGWNTSAGYLWRTTGEWNPMPASFATTGNYLLSAQDPDGDGPEPQWLIAMRDADDAQTSAHEYRVERWNGAEWYPITTPFIVFNVVFFVTVWDQDGAGPDTPSVLIGPNVGTLGSTASAGLLIFENGSWSIRATGEVPFMLRAAMPITRTIPGFPAGSLFVGGRFEKINSVVSLNTAALRACAPPPCIGDINGDGATNATDYNILASNFRAAVAPNTSGDLNGDGIVNALDFNILASDFRCVSP